MELWTDGTTHLQTVDTTATVRLFRDGKLAGQVSIEGVSWKSPVAADPEANRAWVGLRASGRIVELTLEPFRQRAVHDVPLLGLAAVGGGRVAAVIEANRKPVLVIGTPGKAWGQTLPLAFESGHAIRGIAKGRASRVVGKDVRVRANEHGIAIADGQAGVVAVLRPGAAEFDEPWFFGATPETELFAEPTETGVFVVSRFAARDSRAMHLVGEERTLVHGGGGMFAQACGERFLVYTGDDVRLTKTATESVQSIAQRGHVLAGAGVPGVLVLGLEGGVDVIRVKAKKLERAEIRAGDRWTIRARFKRELGGKARQALREVVLGPWSGTSDDDGAWLVEVPGVTPARKDAIVEALERLEPLAPPEAVPA